MQFTARLCTALKIQWVVAPFEADQQCAYASQAGEAGAAWLPHGDSDLPLYGIDSVLFRMNQANGNHSRLQPDAPAASSTASRVASRHWKHPASGRVADRGPGLFGPSKSARARAHRGGRAGPGLPALAGGSARICVLKCLLCDSFAQQRNIYM